MRNSLVLKEKTAQTAIEYLLLLTTVAAIVLVGFGTYLPRFQETTNIYFNRVARGVLGEPPHCGDSNCQRQWFEDCERCPSDCGNC